MVSEAVLNDETPVERDDGIPDELRSCHAVVLDGYVVGGHVPASAIATPLDDGPAIDGIARPGMPRSRPGWTALTFWEQSPNVSLLSP
ncbi:DUF411 domain-containing protein [Halosimplex amylolyticum]|uniref:DUF411 domain-containing protein n=1 Tax=Halosimplex amylolyticum TaxID=3396616 RepID=UPI003F5431F7